MLMSWFIEEATVCLYTHIFLLHLEKDKGYDINYTDGFKRSYVAAALWKCQSKGICGLTLWVSSHLIFKNNLLIKQWKKLMTYLLYVAIKILTEILPYKILTL